MNEMQTRILLGFHLCGSFFTSLEQWEAELEAVGVNGYLTDAESVLPLPLAADSAELQAAYGILLWGTDSSVSIPLWASACKGQGSILIDRTTLSVIRYYHAWGYTPECIDGNPPDYIGDQIRFLEYLCACRLHALDHGTGEEDVYLQAAKKFTQDYFLDTASVIIEGVKSHEQIALLRDIVTAMLSQLPDDEVSFRFDLAVKQSLVYELSFGDVLEKGRYAAIEDTPETLIHTAGYNNCGGRCVINAIKQEDCVTEVSTVCAEDGPQLRACIRGRGYRQTFFNAGRLRYPMKRVGKRGEGKFERISWEEAVDIISSEWIRIRDTYGPSARYSLLSTGNEAMARADKIMKRLLNLDGGYLEGYNTYSIACAAYITPYVYGDLLSGNSMEDLPNTKLLILWGHNPAETLFGTERNYYIMKAKETGAKVIVIDPRYSDSAIAYADEWIGLKPSTDSALADGMAYVIWTKDLIDRDFIDTFCLGFDGAHMPAGYAADESYEAYLLGKKDGIPKTPEWAERITGVPAETIVRLAHDYALTKPACILPGLGLQRTGNGEQTVRSLILLCCLTGNVGITGGGSAGAGGIVGHTRTEWPILDNPYKGMIPHFIWSQAVDAGTELTPEDGITGADRLPCDIKMIFCLASNTLVNQHSNINETVRILKDESKCEFILCSELFMTASAKFADVLLPATSLFEADNLVSAWTWNGNYLLFNNRVRPPLFGCKFELEWIREIAKKLNLLEAFDDEKTTLMDWLAFLYKQIKDKEPELPDFETFRSAGGYRYQKNDVYIAYEKQRKNPVNHPFGTPSGKIEIFSPRLYTLNDPVKRPAIPCYVPCSEGPEDSIRERYPLQLIGWHTKRRAHSMHDNNIWMEEAEPQCVWIHPEDARDRDIGEGDIVRIFNDRGIVQIPAHLTNRIIKGVTAMPQGAWYTPDEDGVDKRGCINVLTSTTPTPYAKGNPQHTNLVEIKKWRHKDVSGDEKKR